MVLGAPGAGSIRRVLDAAGLLVARSALPARWSERDGPLVPEAALPRDGARAALAAEAAVRSARSVALCGRCTLRAVPARFRVRRRHVLAPHAPADRHASHARRSLLDADAHPRAPDNRPACACQPGGTKPGVGRNRPARAVRNPEPVRQCVARRSARGCDARQRIHRARAARGRGRTERHRAAAGRTAQRKQVQGRDGARRPLVAGFGAHHQRRGAGPVDHRDLERVSDLETRDADSARRPDLSVRRRQHLADPRQRAAVLRRHICFSGSHARCA